MALHFSRLTLIRAGASTALLFAARAGTVHAAPMVDSVTVFASGTAVGGTQPNSVTAGNGSVWIEYGNGADSTGLFGSSTIVQYNASTGAIQSQYSIAGQVDGLKIDPTTGLVWALQNQDGNSTLSLINPATHTVSAPLFYAPPYVYGADSGRGYDNVAFRGSQVFLSYTNPASPTDPVIQELNQGHNPTGLLTTTNILLNEQTGTNSDTDSLKTAPNGDLVLTSEGDGPTSSPLSNGVITLVRNPGASNQSVQNVYVTDGMGNNVEGMDDVLFPSARSGELFFTDKVNNDVYEAVLSGLDPNTPIVSLDSFDELGLVDLATGVATPFIDATNIPGGNLTSPAGIDFIPNVPEPATISILGAGLIGLFAARRRRAPYADEWPRRQEAGHIGVNTRFVQNMHAKRPEAGA